MVEHNMSGLKNLNAKRIYDLLIKEELIGSYGKIKFDLNGIELIVKERNVVGNIIQDWIGEWLKRNGISFEMPDNTQDFPDFFLDVNDKKNNLLEIKSFDFDRSANFDIANFQAYCRSLKTKAYRLDADYLVFGYTMNSKGDIKIENMWLKKIWEISGGSEAYPIKVQQKQGVIYNIRPIAWCAKGGQRYKCFRSKQDFVKALYDTLIKYPRTRGESKDWLKEVIRNYKEHTGKSL